MPRNQRLHPRLRVLLPVDLRVGGRRIEAVASNLGVGGLFLLDDARLAGLDAVALFVYLPDGRVIEAGGRIARRQDAPARGLEVPGYGLAFTQLAPSAARAIDEVVGGSARRPVAA